MIIELLEKIPFRLVASVGIAGTCAAIMFHYVVFGPHRLAPDEAKARKSFRRLGFGERLIHACALLSCVTLAVTGLIAAIGFGSRIHGWLWIIHAFAAPVFCFALLAVVAMWARDGRFAGYDWKWMLYMGGYVGIGKHKALPAGRFNAGQKMYFWMIAGLGLLVVFSGIGRMFPVFSDEIQQYLYYLHRYATLLATMVVIGHAYLGTLANPGTFQAALTGRVSEPWARRHHPVWWEECVNKPGKK
ncbi:MAG TPA: cytochrome b/b6 domain-containing protein [Candidatus Hydrogenedentes bacterium]|nr:cytochrome b/b6 domain-containing protein [Candidatus Hydrogenedentota bacterium]HPG66889.1 cytochrome b/b6 domain-containing protein [Candidatus Hydrogenedentota bacterium]